VGTVVISVDAELGWGFHDVEPTPWERIESARDGWRTLLAASEAHEVPLTWAVVGHLLLDGCDGRHPELPTPERWFGHERGPDAWPPAVRYGPELIEAVRSSPVDHEIGSHSFSHVDFGAPETGADLARADLQAFANAADARGLSPRSFVFPYNGYGHRDVLSEFGYTCYRGPPTGPNRSPTGGARRLLEKTGVLDGPEPVVEPVVDGNGLVNLPASMFLFDVDGWAWLATGAVVGDPVLERVERATAAVADDEGVLHLWLHPNNITTERHARRVESVLAHLSSVRADTALEITTMGRLAANVRRGQRVA
jgi:peptidoglycan/xylan/chitin deacetylase (PgdA/CDA1 family)